MADRYALTRDGWARFSRTKIRMAMEDADKMAGYKVLDCLYERGPSTMEEIGKYAGLTYEEIVHNMESLMPWGYIEEYTGR